MKNNKKNSGFPAGKLHPYWKGDKAGKLSKHFWIYNHYGKANKCENKKCLGRSKFYDWANIKNHKYTHNRKDYKMLCRSCHRLRDEKERYKNCCRNGHPWKKKTTYILPDGLLRNCLICRRINDKKRYPRKRNVK